MHYHAKFPLPLLFIFLALSGCSNNAQRALYEGIQTQNEINKSPAERALKPTPSYETYRKERESLKQNEAVAE